MYGEEYLNDRDASEAMAQIDALIDTFRPDVRALVFERLRQRYQITPDYCRELNRTANAAQPYYGALNSLAGMGASNVASILGLRW